MTGSLGEGAAPAVIEVLEKVKTDMDNSHKELLDQKKDNRQVFELFHKNYSTKIELLSSEIEKLASQLNEIAVKSATATKLLAENQDRLKGLIETGKALESEKSATIASYDQTVAERATTKKGLLEVVEMLNAGFLSPENQQTNDQDISPGNNTTNSENTENIDNSPEIANSGNAQNQDPAGQVLFVKPADKVSSVAAELSDFNEAVPAALNFLQVSTKNFHTGPPNLEPVKKMLRTQLDRVQQKYAEAHAKEEDCKAAFQEFLQTQILNFCTQNEIFCLVLGWRNILVVGLLIFGGQKSGVQHLHNLEQAFLGGGALGHGLVVARDGGGFFGLESFARFYQTLQPVLVLSKQFRGGGTFDGNFVELTGELLDLRG